MGCVASNASDRSRWRSDGADLGQSLLIPSFISSVQSEKGAQIEKCLGRESPRPQQAVQPPQEPIDIIGALKRVIHRAAAPAHVVGIRLGPDEKGNPRYKPPSHPR